MLSSRRRILNEQCAILVDFLEQNRELAKGAPVLATPEVLQSAKQKWAATTKKLNAVPGGVMKTPKGWKKYWYEWRHKVKKKASDSRRFQREDTDGVPNRLAPLNNLELRILEISGLDSGPPKEKQDSKDEFHNVKNDDDTDDDRESPDMNKPLNLLPKTTSSTVRIKTRKSSKEKPPPLLSIEATNSVEPPPPKWALDLEERHIAAEERIASALESIACTLKTQEERRATLDERITDALTALAGTVQDLNSGIQDTLQQLNQRPMHNGQDIKEDVFMKTDHFVVV